MLVGTDFPQRLAAAGLQVNVCDGWESRGSSADHQAVVFHWTASSPNETPSSCANYCFYKADDAPHYNVLIDRYGAAWVGAREKANSSGQISGTALNEALRGETDWRSAASRGLSDTTSANQKLFAISAQNSGVGESWSDGLMHGMAVAAAVALESLGLAHPGYVTHHAALTRRKIDLTAGTGGCPDGGTWNRLIDDAMHGKGPPPPKPEEPELWTIERTLHPGDDLTIGLPAGRKTATQMIAADIGSSKLWGCQILKDQADAVGLWGKGGQWEMDIGAHQSVSDSLRDDCQQLRIQNPDSGRAVVSVIVSGT